MLEELCKRIQNCCATLRRSRNIRNVGSCWVKSLTGFKLCEKLPTTRNNMQQGVPTDATCNIQQCCVRLYGALGKRTLFACLKSRANGMYVGPFMLCLYFICERKFYARKHPEVTRQWKSTPKDTIFILETPRTPDVITQS